MEQKILFDYFHQRMNPEKLMQVSGGAGMIQIEDILLLDEEDALCLMRLVQDETIELYQRDALFILYLLEGKHPEWQEEFHKIHVEDYKMILRDKILESHGESEAKYILKYFKPDILEVFQTEEEYSVYLNCIYTDFSSHLYEDPSQAFVECLKNGETCRVEIIQQIMKYYTRFAGSMFVPLTEFDSYICDMDDSFLTQYLSLANSGYDMYDSADLVLMWQDENALEEANVATRYLGNISSSKLNCLLNIFYNVPFSQYEELTSALKMMEQYYPDVISTYAIVLDQNPLEEYQNTLFFESLKPFCEEPDLRFNEMVGNLLDYVILDILLESIDIDEKKNKLSQFMKTVKETSGNSYCVKASLFINSNYDDFMNGHVFDAKDVSTYGNFVRLSSVSNQYYSILWQLLQLKSFQNDVLCGSIQCSFLLEEGEEIRIQSMYEYYRQIENMSSFLEMPQNCEKNSEYDLTKDLYGFGEDDIPTKRI